MKSPDNKVQLSIVIRARNEKQYLQKVFEALHAQDGHVNYEIIVVDNESEDGTRALCRQYGADIVSISQSEFTYGRAINRGIEQAVGEIVVLLSAHSLPIGSDFLFKVLKPFNDILVAAARCISVTDLNDVREWYRPRMVGLSDADYQIPTRQGTKWMKLYPSASCCVLRRRVWEEVQFDEAMEFSEDKFWADEVVQRGYKIVSCVDAFYYYLREWEGIGKLRRLNRAYLALYRATGYAPMSLNKFITRLLSSPFVFLSRILEQSLEDLMLLVIPFQAKIRKPNEGSWQGYNPEKIP